MHIWIAVLQQAPQELELPAKGLECKITVGTLDVTADVLAGTAETADLSKRLALIAENMRAIEAKYTKADPEHAYEVNMMVPGRQYTMFTYAILRDTRLVYVPPRSIGEFGGETDNWVWPRHSGDFSFVRAYVGVDGKPADYAKTNVPYTPARYLHAAPMGPKENDFDIHSSAIRGARSATSPPVACGCWKKHKCPGWQLTMNGASPK